MIVGAAYIPHEDKMPLGEDAYFISSGGRVIGVADGVGGWRDEGIDAGEFARQLMRRSESLVGSWPCGTTDPMKILEAALSKTTAKGTSTACVIAHKGKWLHAAVLGDSGFAVIREHKVVGFVTDANQLVGWQRITVAVKRGDLVVAGSDGLFDNMFDDEILKVLITSKEKGRERVDDLAYDIAQAALAFSKDEKKRTPFSEESRKAGHTHSGGKKDDITVVVARVVCTCD